MVTDGFQWGLEGPIRLLIREVFRKKPNNKNGWTENVKLIKQLKEEGDIVVDLILEELFYRQEKGILKKDVCSSRNSPVFHLIGVACELAQSRHAQQFCQMLLWDEIFETDRGNRSRLVETIGKIGDGTVVSSLRQYIEKLNSAEYSSQSSLVEAGRAIIACQQRG